MHKPKHKSLPGAQGIKGSQITTSFDRDELDAVRNSLRSSENLEYGKFCRSLKPHFGRVYRDIALGYCFLIVVLFAIASTSTIATKVFGAIAGAILIGFAVAYLQLFIHEAAHFNIAANRRLNDLLANVLLSWQVGTTVAQYRKTHSGHHAFLGEKYDTESTYRNSPSASFMFQLLIGIHAIKIYLRRQETNHKGCQSVDRSRRPGNLLPLAIGASAHLAIVVSLISMGATVAAISWVIGMGMFFPFFAAIRQMLEHRPSGDLQDGTATTRLFDDGIFGRLFGGAGFNRHLLHHLEPQISYTRLEEFERYLSEANLKSWLDEKRSTYFATLCSLRQHARHV